MASLYKRSFTSTDSVTGKTIRRKTSSWYGKYRDAEGIARRVPLSRNKTAAGQMLNELVRLAELGKVGLVDPSEAHRKLPLKTHVADFRKHLESKGNTADHVALIVARVQAAFTGCGFRLLSDLDADKVSHWLKSRRDEDDARKRFGIATSNHHLVAVKSFGNWLVRSQRLGRNPFAHLSRLNAKIDVRIERRAMATDELSRLVDAAAKSAKTFRGLTGPDRAALYLLATMTGLRANELATLRRSAFDFKAEPPTVTVDAENGKARHGAELPLHPFVVNRLSTWLESRPKRSTTTAKAAADELLWPGTWSEKAANMFRRDLAEARAAWLKEVNGIADELKRRTESDFLKAKSVNGEKADFHALRHSFITLLASSGVHPKVAQQLARHSTITLTMDRYSHCHLSDMNAAVGTLPSLAPQNPLLSPVDARLATVSTGPSTGPRLAPAVDSSCDPLMTADETLTELRPTADVHKPLKKGVLRTIATR